MRGPKQQTRRHPTALRQGRGHTTQKPWEQVASSVRVLLLKPSCVARGRTKQCQAQGVRAAGVALGVRARQPVSVAGTVPNGGWRSCQHGVPRALHSERDVHTVGAERQVDARCLRALRRLAAQHACTGGAAVCGDGARVCVGGGTSSCALCGQAVITAYLSLVAGVRARADSCSVAPVTSASSLPLLRVSRTPSRPKPT